METIDNNESDNNVSIEFDNTTHDSDEQIPHNLTVQDSVTQIEIEHNEQDKQEHLSHKLNTEMTITHTNNNDNCENNKTSLSPLPIHKNQSNTNNQNPNTLNTHSNPDPSHTDTQMSETTTNTRLIRAHKQAILIEDDDEDEIDGKIDSHNHSHSNEDEDDDISMKNSSNNSADPDDNFDPNAPCGICWVARGYDYDPLVYCDGCNVPLHKLCYCIRKVPEEDYWCKVCAYQIEKEGKPLRTKDYLGRKCKCSICQLRFRSKKLAYTTQKMSNAHKKQKWCHVICAQYVSETWFDEGSIELNNVCNVDGIRRQRYEGECEYCHREKGAKVFCSIMQCQKKFHAACGLVNHCMLQDVADPDAEYSNRVVYCPEHLPKLIRKEGNALIKKRLQQSQDITINGNQNNLGWGATWDMKIASTQPNERSYSEKEYNAGEYNNVDARESDEDYVKKPRKRRLRKKVDKTRVLKKKSPKANKRNKNKNLASMPPNMGTQPPPLAPIYSRRGGFFHNGLKSTGPRSMGLGPRAKKKFAANYKKRKEAPTINTHNEPPNKKQRISPPKPTKPINPNHIPKRSMPKYTQSPNLKPKESISVRELVARSAPKRFEQKGKVRFIKPNVQTSNNKAAKLRKHRLNNNMASKPKQPPPPPPPPMNPLLPTQNYKVFPKRPNEIWNTRMVHSKEKNKKQTSINKLDFKVSFVWRAGCTLEWPFANIEERGKHGKVSEKIACSWKKDFAEIEKYMKEIRPGGKKQHLSHHWMLCEIHPYSTEDVGSYGDFCNYYKDLSKVSAAMCKSEMHQHLLFYLCPPDETVLPEQYLDDIFHCKIPKGLLWCLIFVKNLMPMPMNGNGNASVSVAQTVKKSGGSAGDPRKKKKTKGKGTTKVKKVKAKERKKKVKVTGKEKEQSEVDLGVEVDGGNLLGMLGSLEDTLKDEAGVKGDGEDVASESMVLTNSQEF